MTEPHILRDLLHHTDQRIGQTFTDTINLLDDEGEAGLFALMLFSRILARVGQQVLRKETLAEALNDTEAVLTAATLVTMMVGLQTGEMKFPEPKRIIRRADALLKQYSAAAGVVLTK